MGNVEEGPHYSRDHRDSHNEGQLLKPLLICELGNALE